MDFKSFLGNSEKTPNEGENQKPESSPSNSELFSNAKVVAEAARSTFNKESDKVDKAKAAEAAADLLDAAESYGKLDQKGLGSYLDKAEQYLHNYKDSSSPSPNKPVDSGEPPAAESPAKPSADGEEKSEGGGYGQYMKMAEGLFKK